MREKIEPCMELIDNAKAAMESLGIPPHRQSPSAAAPTAPGSLYGSALPQPVHRWAQLPWPV